MSELRLINLLNGIFSSNNDLSSCLVCFKSVCYLAYKVSNQHWESHWTRQAWTICFQSLFNSNSIFCVVINLMTLCWACKGKDQSDNSVKLYNMGKVKGIQSSIIFQRTYEALKFWNLFPVTKLIKWRRKKQTKHKSGPLLLSRAVRAITI